jgi:hypothetical protein
VRARRAHNTQYPFTLFAGHSWYALQGAVAQPDWKVMIGLHPRNDETEGMTGANEALLW